jgi:hypothetical protein
MPTRRKNEMSSREFCYWLQGYFEIVAANPAGTVPPNGLTGPQADTIRRHLGMVFTHEIDPSYPNAEALNKIHAGQNASTKDVVYRC